MDSLAPRPGLPAHAKRVFKGEIFEVWQWEQKMFDGTTNTFERIWRYSTVEIFATVGDKIILEDQDQPDRKGSVTVPSGRMDQGEDDPLVEAKRELLEETGYTSDDWTLFMTLGRDSKVIHEIHHFIARNCIKTSEQQLDSGEKIATRLISFDEFLELVDEPRFWMSAEFKNYMLRARFDPEKKEEFRKALFP
ncbi:MAG: NUDIX hydrolase [Patescibacteria group bacterium]|nr:NUDIX hydrolase [Patescibacteria group bacterium]